MMNDAQGALNETLRGVRTQIEGTNLTQRVGEQPWLALGAALAAGYLIGSAGGGNGNARLKRPGMASQAFERMSSGPRPSTNDFAHRPPGSNQSQSQPGPAASQFSSYGSSQPSYVSGQSSYAPSQFSSYGSSQSSYSPSQPSYAPSQASDPQKPSTLDDLLGPVRGELDTLRAAAITTARRWLRDTVREAMPSMRQQIDELDRKQSGTIGAA